MWGPNPALLREELELGVPSWLCGAVLGAGLRWECVSAFPTCFRCGYFLTYPIRRSHSVCFWISFKGSCSVCSCILSASVWGGEFRTFCVITLLNLQDTVSIIGQPLQLNLTGPKFSSCWRTGTIVSGRVCLFLFCLFIVHSQHSSHNDPFTNKSF